MSVTLRKKKLKKGFSYYLDIYNNGKRSYETLFKVLPIDNLKEKKDLAIAIKNRREIEIYNEEYDFIKKNNKMFFYNFIDDYLQNYNKKDVNTIRACIVKFKEFSPDFVLSRLNPVLIEEYFHFLENYGLKGDTPKSYYRRFKKILNYGVKVGLININILNKVRVKSNFVESNKTLKKNVLNEDELKILSNTECGNNEIKKAFLFSCYCGLGYAEIICLSNKDILNGRLKVKRKKTNTEINIKLSNNALYLINHNRNTLFNLINSNTNKPLSENGVNKTLKNWMKRAGIDKHITFYCARHTFAVRLLKNKVNLKVISDALGHKSMNNTYKYLSQVDEMKDEATSNL